MTVALLIAAGIFFIVWTLTILFMRGATVPAPVMPHVTTENDWWIATAKTAHKRRAS